MIVTPVKTPIIRPNEISLEKVIEQSLPELHDGSVLAITSKIVALCEGAVVKKSDVDKDKLIRQQAEFYLPRSAHKYNFLLTIKHGVLAPSAGIDESNGEDIYILWPQQPQQTANQIRQWLAQKFGLRRIGVVITDSRTIPLRWGTSGVSLAHSGFAALNNYIGEPDLFGQKLMVTKASIADGLAMAAVLVMGEGNEQTPLAVLSDIPFVEFQDRNPTQHELDELKISREDDLFGPLLTGADWQKGGH